MKQKARGYIVKWGCAISPGVIVDRNAKITLPNITESGRDEIGLWVEMEVEIPELEGISISKEE